MMNDTTLASSSRPDLIEALILFRAKMEDAGDRALLREAANEICALKSRIEIRGSPVKRVEAEALDAEDLDTIETIARNDQTGRITPYEVRELLRGYRAFRASLPEAPAVRPERVQAAFEVFEGREDCGPNAAALFEYIRVLEAALLATPPAPTARHFGDPCVYCGIAHDDVPSGACRGERIEISRRQADAILSYLKKGEGPAGWPTSLWTEVQSFIAGLEKLLRAPAPTAAVDGEIQQLREFAAWVDTWVSNPAGAYSVHALIGLFAMTRDRLFALTKAHLSPGTADKLDGNRPLPFDRDQLGRFVREAWVRWAETQPSPKPSWLVPYDELAESDKEADRQIGEAVARWTLIGDAASFAFASPGTAEEGKPACGLANPSYHDCPNMKEVGGGFEGERYRCAVCGKGYFLDYDDMK